MIAADHNKPEIVTAEDANNSERMVRRAALLAIMKSAQDELQASTTIAEYERGILRLRDVSNFMQSVKNNTLDIMRDTAEGGYDETEGLDFEQDFPEAEGTTTLAQAGQDAKETVTDAGGFARIGPYME